MTTSTPRRPAALGLIVAISLILAFTSQASAQTTALFADSQGDNSVGLGRKHTLTTVDANFRAEKVTPNWLTITVTTPNFATTWRLEFRAPGFGQQPVAGTYNAARRGISSYENGLDVSGPGGGCAELTGRFVVLEAEYASDGTVLRFAADFEQHCADVASGTYGAIRYKSTIAALAPFGGAYPVYQLTVQPPANGRIQGSGIDCGGPASICTSSPGAATRYTLTATPDAGHVFAGWTGDCSGESSTTIHVNGPKVCSAAFISTAPGTQRTLAVIHSAPGEFIGRGRTTVLSSANSRWTLTAITATRFAVDMRTITNLDGSYWRFELAPPTGQVFEAGREYLTTQFGGTATAALSVSSDHSTCSPTGTLAIHDWMGSPTSSLPSRFAFAFDIACPGTAPLAGTVVFESTADFPIVQLSKPSLHFSGTVSPSDLVSHSPEQSVRLLQVGAGTLAWQLKSDAEWLTASPPSGTGPAVITVRVRSGAGLSPPAPAVGHIRIIVRGTLAPTPPITVTLTMHTEGSTAPPFGVIDAPLDGATGVQGSIAIGGWALDDIGVTGVRLFRDPVAGDPPGQVFIGNAVFVDGARPDVAAIAPSYPLNGRAGWGYMLLTNMLPNRGEGRFTLHAYADDAEGQSIWLGSRTITCTNASATTPFGAIDTPGQGDIVGGSVNNFGWVLAPGTRRADPPAGGSVTVFIDGVPVGSPFGWAARQDLSATFPHAQYSGVSTALGVFTFDSRSLADGVHTIAWGVTDNAGGAAGIGSRYFTVANGSSLTAPQAMRLRSVSMMTSHAAQGAPLTGRRGFDLDAPYRTFPSDASGVTVVQARQLERVELRTSAFAARLLTPGGSRTLPIGASLAADGTFTWQPGVAFAGAYDFEFDAARASRRVRIVLNPVGSSSVGVQTIIDSPVAGESHASSFTIRGWSADLDAATGTGIDAVHVWAYPADGGAPKFLGAATTTERRSDVAAAHGAQFLRSGYELAAAGLTPGDYTLAVFPWQGRTQRFLPASTAPLSIGRD